MSKKSIRQNMFNNISKQQKMKKGIIGLFIIATAAITSWNFNQKNEIQLTDLALDNIEALASGESSSDCNTYCTSDYRYYCIVDYGSASVSCPQHRRK